MKLGEDTIVLRKRQVIPDIDDGYGNPIAEDVDQEVRWCLVTPTRSTETDGRSAPAVAGVTLLAPPGTPVEAADVILWAGRAWEVAGEAGLWEECVEAQLRRST